MAQNHHFLKGYPYLTLPCVDLVERRRLGPWPLKFTFNAENLICRLSWSISAKFTLKMCVAVQNRKNSLKLFILKIQGHSRSSILTFVRSSSPVLVMISSMSVPICNHFYGRRANSGKITSFLKGGCPYFAFSFVETPLIQRHKILSQNSRDARLYVVKIRSLYLTWLWNGTGTWQTQDTKHQDKITIANTRSRVKTILRTYESMNSLQTNKWTDGRTDGRTA